MNNKNKKQEYQEERDIDIQKKPQLLNKNVMNKVMDHNGDGEDEYYDSEEDPDQVVNFDQELKYIKNLKGVDIIFVIDTTASMSPFFAGVKRFVRKLIQDANKTLSQYIVDEVNLLKVGMVLYKDHPPQDKTYITKVIPLTSDFAKFKEELKKTTAKGGGDEAEAVLDGLYEAVFNIKWRSKSEKFIYHVLDGPPHGEDFSFTVKDNFLKGCPCGYDYEQILIKMREMEIEYNIVKLSNDLDPMIELFQKVIKIDVMVPDIAIDPSKKISQTD